MAATTFIPVYGVVQSVTPLQNQCCGTLVSLFTSNGIVRFTVGPDTYVIDNTRLFPGLPVVAFYDPTMPVPLIFPPQYHAAIIGRRQQNESAFAGLFHQDLVSADQSLRLNIGSTTQITTANGQPFSCTPGGQFLIVFYSATTRSIPPQTTPRRIIVFCQS